jgi:pimeloyl-ACP methyl ester carboxylesterase
MVVLAWIILILLALLALGVGALVIFTARTARQVEAALPPLGRFIDIDGARIHYLDRGSGPTILCIHGLAGQMRHFTYALLDKLKSDYRLVIVDRPGSGYSTRPPEASAAIFAQARTLAKFAEALRLDRPLVVGHSLGGAIALALALNHSEQVGGLALLAPLTHPQEELPPVFRALAIRSPLMRWIMAWTLAIPLSIRNATTVLNAVFGPQLVPTDFPSRGGGLLGLRPSAFITASTDLIAVPEDLEVMPGRYQNLTQPVGILFGTGDRILNPEAQGKALAAKIPGADLELIEGEGHMVPICSADRSANFITRMAQRVAGLEAKLAPVA